jgi:4-amino-4-deoxy-L-arabinose transferase-like glycosyltransferase
VSFHPDESEWIATSFYFEAFLNRWAAPSLWNGSYWTLTQPPVARYTIALGRLAGGYGVGDLNQPWRFGIDDATNITNGAMPGPGLLWWSRLPMALLAALSVVVLLRLVTNAAGRLAGYTAVVLLAGNPYLYRCLCRAMSEAPLVACVVLFALAGNSALLHWQRAATDRCFSFKALRPAGASFFLMGTVCGLAAAAKLNGFAAVVAGLALCFLTITHRGNVPRPARLGFLVAGTALLLLGTALVFVVVNPYLYPDPLGRTLAMFHHRLGEFRTQSALYSGSVIRGTTARVNVVSGRVLQDYATISFSGSRIVNFLLGALGASFLMQEAWLWLRGYDAGRTSVVILTVALTTATPALFTPFDWERYFLLPVIFSTVCVAIGISASLTRLSRWLRVRAVSGQSPARAARTSTCFMK